MQRYEIKLPATGGIDKIVLHRWYFPDHAQVEIGAALCEIASRCPPELRIADSDEFAASLEIVTEWKGTLKIIMAEGSVVRPHEILAYILPG